MERITISGTIGRPEPELDKMLQDAGIGQFFSASEMRDFFGSLEPQESVEIVVDSVGGDVGEGFEIYDLIRAEINSGREVTTIGKRYDSIASIIFLAGTQRKHVKGANPLIHNSWLTPESLEGYQLNKEVLREIAAGNEMADKQMLVEYVKLAGRDRMNEVEALMAAETQLTDQQVLELNFATELIAGDVHKQGRAYAFNRKALKAALLSKSAVQYADFVGVAEGGVLLVQRSMHDDFEGGKWAFPGGKVEEGETPEQAALRELKEETGYMASEVVSLGAIDNDDGSTSHYFAGMLVGSLFMADMEIDDAAYIGAADLQHIDVILGQADRYELLINKLDMLSENEKKKLTALEKGVAALQALFTASKKAMKLELADGKGEIYIPAEDGEPEGKRAVLVENGEPTETPAPAGTHSLNDGRTITIGEGGIVESVQEASAMDDEMERKMADMEQELEAAKAAKAESDEKYEALNAKYEEQKSLNDKSREALNALKAQFEEFKEEVPGDKGKKPAQKAQGPAGVESMDDWRNMTIAQRRAVNLKLKAQKN